MPMTSKVRSRYSEGSWYRVVVNASILHSLGQVCSWVIAAARVQGYLIGSVLYGAIMYSLPFSLGLASQALNLPVSSLPLTIRI